MHCILSILQMKCISRKSFGLYYIIVFMNIEQTFLAIKPNAVQRGDSVAIVKLLQEKLPDAQCLAMKLYTPTKELAQQHYAALSDKPFFPELIESFTSGPILGMVWQGENIIARAREAMGATNPADADEGTIRKIFAKSINDNAIHGSDTEPGSASREIEIHFADLNAEAINDVAAEAAKLSQAFSV
jgi:nucleoside-diphosphate kinase